MALKTWSKISNLRKGEKSDNIIQDLKLFLETYNVGTNCITSGLEIDGKPINDRMLNDIALKAFEIFGTQAKKALVVDILESSFSKEFNPFLQFIEKHEHIKPSGAIQQVIDCLVPVDQSKDYLRFRNDFVRRWLLSIMASIHGTYSTQVLVLCGSDHGMGKTKWFRGLLPEGLETYFSECKFRFQKHKR